MSIVYIIVKVLTLPGAVLHAFLEHAVCRGAKVVVECDGQILSSKKKIKLAPGEMENVTITAEMLSNMNKDSEITVRIEQ